MKQNKFNFRSGFNLATTSVKVAAFCAIISLFLTACSVRAALPLYADGQPLPSLAPMLEKIQPAVVNISTASTEIIAENPLLRDPFFKRFFDMPRQPRQRERRSQALGSGVIVDAEQGLVLTNAHVIDKADEITVRLNDGREFKAELIGSDPGADIAVIKIEANKLVAIKMADSEKIRVGDFVVAIGNPFGLSETVTSGIISGLGRSGLGIEGYEDFIQTDAAINVGNSGGALVNLRGELIGVNTAILAPSGGSVGIGFAIPVNMAQNLMAQLIEFGDVRRGLLGVLMQDMTRDLAQAFGYDFTRGAIVTQVLPNSAAEAAGVKESDLIVAVDDTVIEDASDLRNAIGLLREGDETMLSVIRGGKRKTINAKIGVAQIASRQGDVISKKLAGALFGNADSDPNDPDATSGVEVVEIERGSPAYESGLRQGDRIVSVNRNPIRNTREFKDVVTGQNTLVLNVQRGQGALFIVIQ